MLVVNWDTIDWVLLDMDGTLLDLHFDNYFWLDYLPAQYAQMHNMSHTDAISELTLSFDAMRGKLEWYCLDYWTSHLNLPVAELKHEIRDKIRLREQCPEFLQRLNRFDKHIALVTNAHPDALSIKLEQTGIAINFHHIISTHDLGYPKERQECWLKLQTELGFDPQRTLFIDDSEAVLKSARQFGIRYCFDIAHPDSQKEAKQQSEFPLIHSFSQLFDNHD